MKKKDILDLKFRRLKCLENFLALTITTPIPLSALFSIQLVDGLAQAFLKS